MRTNRITLLVLLALGIFAFYACEKNDDDFLSKDEAEQLIKLEDKEYGRNADRMKFSDSYYLLRVSDYFFNELTSNQYDDSYIEIEFSVSEVDFSYELKNVNQFNNITGTWTPSSSWYGFTRTSTTPSDKVIIIYPSDYGNVKATFYDYNNQNNTISVKVKIEKNNAVICNLTCSRTENTQEDSRKTNATITFGSYSIEYEESDYDYSNEDKDKDIEKIIIKKDNKVFFSKTYNIQWEYLGGVDYYNIVSKWTFGNLELNLNVDTNSKQIDNSDRNTFINFSASTKGKKVGDFVYEKDELWKVLFKFTNGEKVEVEGLMPQIYECLKHNPYSDIYWDIYDGGYK